MKNFKYLFLAVAAVLCMTSCDWFVLDNMEGYDATIYGKIIDAETGELVLSEISNSTGNIKVVEQGWTEEGAQQLQKTLEEQGVRTEIRKAEDLYKVISPVADTKETVLEELLYTLGDLE